MPRPPKGKTHKKGQVTIKVVEKVMVERPKKKKQPARAGAMVVANRAVRALRRELSSFDRAMIVNTNPFHRQGFGARICEHFASNVYSAPIQITDMLSTGADGSAQMLVLPNLSCSTLVLAGSVAGSNKIFAFSGRTETASYQNTVVPVTRAGQAADRVTAVEVYASTYRIVGWGMVIKTLPGLSASGRIILAKFVPTGKAPIAASEALIFGSGTTLGTGAGPVTTAMGVPEVSTLKSRFTLENFLIDNGLPYDAAGDRIAEEALRRLPVCASSSVASLGSSALLICGKRTSNEYMHWRGTGATSAPAGDVFTAAQTVTQAGVPTSSNTKGYTLPADTTYLDLTGYDGVSINVSGAAINTSVIDYEIIYHVEAVPKINMPDANSGRNGTTIQPALQDVISHPNAEAQINANQQRTPHIKIVPHHFREFMNGVITGAGGYASQLLTGTAGTAVGNLMASGGMGLIGGAM